MGGRIAVALSALRYAEQTGRELIVDWNDYAYFSPGADDVFRSLFDAPTTSAVALEQVQGCSVFPKMWDGKLLEYRNSTDAEIMPYELSFCTPPALDDAEADEADVVVVTRNSPINDLRAEYRRLRPAAPTRGRIEAFDEATDVGDRVGVHVRHGNGEYLVVPAETAWFQERLAALDTGSSPRLMVATDSRVVVEEFNRLFADVAHTPKWYPTPGTGSMHQNSQCPDRFENAVEAIVDMWVLARCRHLLLCRGFFGETVRNLVRDHKTPVEIYPGKIHPTVTDKVGWDNPI